MTTQDLLNYYQNLLLLQHLPCPGPQTVTTVADSSGSLTGTYFTMYDGAVGQGYIFCMVVGGSGGPPPLWPPAVGTQIPAYIPYLVNFPENSSSSTVATALASVIQTLPNFSQTIVSGNVITLVNGVTGPFAIATDQTTGFSFSNSPSVLTIETVVLPAIMNQLLVRIQNAFQIGPANWNNAPNWSPVSIYSSGNQVYSGGTVYVSLSDENQDNDVTDPIYWTPLFSPAVGAQLDILGKYVGVNRTGVGVYQQPITLSDSDFTKLIQLGISKNNFGSSLQVIDEYLFTWFPNEIFAYDNENMSMSYLMTSSIGSQNFVQMAITQGLLPKPMGVALATVLFIPNLGLFGMTSYADWTIVDGSPVYSIPTWNSSVTYAIGAEVVSGGIVYQSVIAGNLNNPVTNTNFWTAIIFPATTYSSYGTYTDTPAYIGNWHWLSYADAASFPT